MIEELEKRRIKLSNLSWHLEQCCAISTILTLIFSGALIGSLPNYKCSKNPLRISAIAFLFSSGSLLLGCGLNSKIDRDLEQNSKQLDIALSKKPNCHGCVYASNDDFLPCAVHPVYQPENCTDKKVNNE